MIDFENMVNSAKADGLSYDQIAAAFTRALNNSKKEMEEALRKAREAEKTRIKVDEREAYLKSVEATFFQHIREGHTTLKDAAAMIFYGVVKNTETGKNMKTVEELKTFQNFVEDEVAHILDRWELSQSLHALFGKFGLNSLGDLLEDKKQCDCAKAKAKTVQKVSEDKDDKATVDAFLKAMFGNK